MNEEPQPSAAPESGAGAPAEPAAAAQQPAATPQEPQSQGQPVAQASSSNDEYTAWLQSKGLSPDGEQAEKAAKMAYNSEKLMSKATAEASELRKSLTQPSQPQQPTDGSQGDPMMQEFIQDYRRDKLIGSFKDSHPDWAEHEPTMVDILSQQTPSGYTNSQLVNAGILSLEAVYAMAKGAAPANTDQIQTQAKHEVLQTLANTQRAGGGNAQASNSNPQAPNEDPVLAGIKRSRGA